MLCPHVSRCGGRAGRGTAGTCSANTTPFDSLNTAAAAAAAVPSPMRMNNPFRPEQAEAVDPPATHAPTQPAWTTFARPPGAVAAAQHCAPSAPPAPPACSTAAAAAAVPTVGLGPSDDDSDDDYGMDATGDPSEAERQRRRARAGPPPPPLPAEGETVVGTLRRAMELAQHAEVYLQSERGAMVAEMSRLQALVQAQESQGAAAPRPSPVAQPPH
jgi:hypothetical protein